MAGFYGGYMGNEAGVKGLMAGSPSFDINRGKGALGGRSGEQLKRLYEAMPQNQQLQEELMKRGIMPGSGPRLPFAMGPQGIPPMGNPGFFMGPQMGQVPAGFQNKYVS